MSILWIITLTLAACVINGAWARLIGENWTTTIVAGMCIGFVIPWGVASIVWLIAQSVAA